MSGAAPKHVDDDGHIDDGIPSVQSPLAASGEADRGLKEARRDSVPGSETCAAPRDSDSDDGALEELESIDDPDGVLKELMGRLQSVMGALSETERQNDLLQGEIKSLLSDQDEQHELRDELGEQLRERSDLMAQLANQALSDTEQNSDILRRIAQLSEDAEKERAIFSGEMARLDAQLEKLGAQ